MPDSLTLSAIQEQAAQAHSTRVDLYQSLEDEIGTPVVAYFAAFDHRGSMIQDDDASMLQDVLQASGIKGDFTLMISSPGGFPESAERFVSVCRAFADGGKFSVLVPGLAKSAATMIAFGADEIIMSEVSELGPVDPQVPISNGNGYQLVPAYTLVKVYDGLFRGATRSKGNIEPYILQLKEYRAHDISYYKDAISLSEDISIKHLQQGMMKGKTSKAIKKQIKLFLDPSETRSHGRPISARDAIACGLSIREETVHGATWGAVFALGARLDNFVRTRALKVLETRQHSLSWGSGQ